MTGVGSPQLCSAHTVTLTCFCCWQGGPGAGLTQLLSLAYGAFTEFLYGVID